MKRITFFYSLLALLSLSSCIKEKYEIDYEDNTKRLITEFTDSRNEINSAAFAYSEDFIEIDLTELQIYRSEFSGDVKVKIAENNALIDAFNINNPGATYEAPPAGSYSLVSTEYTLSPTNKKTKVKLRVKPSAIAGGAYAIGLSIAEVSQGEISSIYKNVLVELLVKNDYEGSYTATGLRKLYSGTTPSSGVSSTFEIDDTKYLYTIDNTTVEVALADLAAWMQLKIDPATNEVTVLPGSFGDTFASLENNGDCTYDPATKTFTLHYKYFNASGLLREIEETLVAE